MKKLTPIFLASTLFLHGEEFAIQSPLEQKAKRELDSGNEKRAIQDYQTLIKEGTPEKKGGYLKDLSIAYLKDQEAEKAFSTFLMALKETLPPKTAYQMSETEQQIYEEALKIYLDPRERDSQEIALKIRDLYAGLYRLHPTYHELGYLVAISYANLDQYEKFFNIFYPSYQYIPEHFLAYKTKAILYIKVYERGRTPEEKNEARLGILSNLQNAKQLYPSDPSLYRLQIVFASQEEKQGILKRNLKEIIDNNMIVPRSDLSFYFDQLFTYGLMDLANQFLEKASKWYPYSRTLEAAKELMEEKKMGNENSEQKGL